MRFEGELGLGIGWRPEIALFIERRLDLGFVEVLAESLAPGRPVPQAIENLRARGVQVVPHGVSLEAGHLLPLPRTWGALAVLVDLGNAYRKHAPRKPSDPS